MATKPSAVASTVAPKKRGRPRKQPAEVLSVAKAADALSDFADLGELFNTPLKVVPLEEQSYEDLFNKAQNVYRIPVTRDYTKGDIIDAIRRKTTSGRMDHALAASDVDADAIPPGFAKVELYKDTSPKAANRPQYFMCNGYKCTIPFGIPVLIPLKILGVLETAVTESRVEDSSVSARTADSARFKTVKSFRFPFSLLGKTPGPDPRPVMETTKKLTHAPRMKFYDMFQFWPTTQQLQEAVKDGVIKLGRGA